MLTGSYDMVKGVFEISKIITFQLKPGRDDDLITWVESFPAGDTASPADRELSRSAAIRRVLRERLQSGDSEEVREAVPVTKPKLTETKSAKQTEAVPHHTPSEEEMEDLEDKLNDLF